MIVARHPTHLAVSAETYTLTFPSDRPFVRVDDAQGTRLLDLFVLSGVHPLHGRDDTVGVGTWQIEETPDEIVCSLHAQSSVWDQKVYRFRCQPCRFRYEIDVVGTGQLVEVQYFGGYSSASLRWGTGFSRSGQHFRRGFNPEPTSEETPFFTPEGNARIDLGGVSLPGRGDWYFTPPPFAFAFESANGWISLGVEAASGANRWTEYTYHGGRGFHLSLSYEGHTTVHATYTLPAIGVDFGSDPYDLLQAHVAALHAQDAAPAIKGQQAPAWWHEPLFCGWGAQCAQAARDGGAAPTYARQALYEQWIDVLAGHDVWPGTVVIDDKWQSTYGDNCVDGERWPDLPGFIAGQHADGRRVLLWLKAWDAEGVPPDECVTNAAGLPVTVDPTNPAYERRLRAAVRRMLGSDGYDADGFKIDFTARLPSGPGLHTHGDLWGLELMKALLHIIHDEAKRTKPDALVITHTPHPYLTDVLDMIRLNDALQLEYLADPSFGHHILGAMRHRAAVAKIACPHVPIDTDNWPMRDRATWRQYTEMQPQLGVPALYFATHIDLTGEPLEADDYALLRRTWAHHRATIASHTASQGGTNDDG